MLTIEKILFPTDISRSSLRAFPFAVHLVKLLGADLHRTDAVGENHALGV